MESGLELLVTTEVAFTRFFLSRRIHHARNFRKSCGRDADSLFAPMFVAKKKKDIARARHVQYVSKSWPNDVSSFSTSDSNKWESGGEGGEEEKSRNCAELKISSCRKGMRGRGGWDRAYARTTVTRCKKDARRKRELPPSLPLRAPPSFRPKVARSIFDV